MVIPATSGQRRAADRRGQWLACACVALVIAGALGLLHCETEGPPSRPEDIAGGCGVALLLPPRQAWPAEVAEALVDTTQVWVYRLGRDAEAPYTQRPAPGDSAGLWAAGVSAGDGPIELEIEAVPAGSWMRLFVRRGPLAASTTFWLSPADRTRNVVLALARATPAQPRIVGFRGVAADPVVSPPMLPPGHGDPPAMLFAIVIENPEALGRLAMRFLVGGADSIGLYVDPGSRLYASGSMDNLRLSLSRWEDARDADQVFTLQIDPCTACPAGTILDPGSDVLLYLQTFGSTADTALCIDPAGALFCLAGEDMCFAPEVISPAVSSFPVGIHVGVSSPSAGAAFCRGDSVNVCWELSGDMGLGVEITLLHDGEPCGAPLARVAGATTFQWIAEPWAGQVASYAFRICERGSGVAGTSAEFSIEPQCALTLLAPDGGEEFIEGEEIEIIWDRTTCCGPRVSIELLRGGSAQAVLGASLENSGHFGWLATQFDSLAAGYQVRVTDLQGGATDISDETFTIHRGCTLGVTSPNGGEQWIVGDPEVIAWETDGACGPAVRIELLEEAAVCAIIADSAANQGTYNWVVARTGDESPNFAVRVVDLTSGAEDASNAGFTIRRPCTLAQVSPQGGEQFTEGEPCEIVWTAAGACGEMVKIELLQAGQVCQLLTAATPNDGSYTWPVQRCGEITTGYRIRVTDLGSGAAASSAASFDIQPFQLPCTLDLESPNGGEAWIEGDPHEITWVTQGGCGPFVRIELLYGGAACALIADSTENDGYHPWQPAPCAGAPGPYAVRITDLSGAGADSSDGLFTITPRCSLAVSSPNGSEVCLEGMPTSITWGVAGACGATVRIELLKNGQVCLIVAAGTENDGEHTWVATRCDADTAGYSVRITDPTSGAQDESDGTFAIVPVVLGCSITVTRPASGDVCVAGQEYAISWATEGACGRACRIDLLHDGVACAAIADSTPNDGAHPWVAVACGAYESGYAVRVTDLESGVQADGEGQFTILPACGLSILSPNGGEIWVAGEGRSIAWNAAGACGAGAAIELLLAGSVCATIADRTDNDGLYLWTATPCGTAEYPYTIRITDLASQRTATSASPFRIRGVCAVEVVSPNGGEVWAVGDSVTLAWNTAGACGEAVRIELLRNGMVCRTLGDSVPNLGAFAWVAEQCDGQESGYRLRVRDLAGGAADESDGDFSIGLPCGITVSSPPGNAQWYVGETYIITWSAPLPCSPSVSIELLRNDILCEVIAANTLNDGEYAWTATRYQGQPDGYRIRVTDTSSQCSGTSEAFRLILPCTIQVTAPNGDEQWFTGQDQTITWYSSQACGERVRIELLNAGVLCHTIAPSAANSGSYVWTAQQCSGVEDGYQVRVTAPETGVSDSSDAPFRITEGIILVRPDGSGTYPTIQAAIDDVSPGAVIYLADGVFAGEGNRDVDFRGKGITVRSLSGDASVCTVDCNGTAEDPHRGFYFHSGETAAATLEGISIVGGWHLTHGGGICCEGSSPTIRQCVIDGNNAGNPALPGSGRGAGVACRDLAAPSFTDCVVRGNSAYHGGGLSCEGDASPAWSSCIISANAAITGGGLWCDGSSPRLTDCLLSDNGASYLGGAVAGTESAPEFVRCGFVRNSAHRGGGSYGTMMNLSMRNCTLFENWCSSGGCLVADSTSTLTLENTIIASTLQGSAIECSVDGQAMLTCCDLHGNTGGDWVGCVAGQLGLNGNIAADPLFCDPVSLDLRLQAGSPCAPFSPPNPSCDLIGAYAVGCSSPGR